MLVDMSVQLPDDALQFDVCIVGSGPAGITLAREISGSGFRVALLESGGRKPAEEPQSLNTGAVDSAHGYEEQILHQGRCRQFGGTSNLWNHKVRGGSDRYIRYVPLDEIDFERRDWVPESGWPFSRRDLQPFYDLARRVCGVGKLDYSALEIGTEKGKPWETEKIESVVSQFGSSEIFLDQYRRQLLRDERVAVILQAVLLRFQMDPLSRAITSAQASLADGRTIQVRAKVFVLAAGGLENPRILLLQDNLQPGGLGNQHDMVGRCFMDHPQVKLGTLIPSSSAVFERARFYDQHERGWAIRHVQITHPPRSDAPGENAQSLRGTGAAFQGSPKQRPGGIAPASVQRSALSVAASFGETSRRNPDPAGTAPFAPSTVA